MMEGLRVWERDGKKWKKCNPEQMIEHKEEIWNLLPYNWLFRSTGDNLDLQLESEVVRAFF